MSQNRATNIIVHNMLLACRKPVAENRPDGLIKNGFTLVEMLITIAIAAILAFIAAPSMNESIQNSKTKKLSTELTVAMHLAHSEAIKRGIQVSIEPNQTSGNEWLKGWNIFTDPNGNGVQDTGEELIQTFEMPANGLTLVSKDSVFASWLGFLPSGATKGNSGISGGFRICRADGDITKSRDITIQGSGNIITKEGTSSCP